MKKTKKSNIVLISPFFFDLVTGVLGVVFVMFILSASSGLDIQPELKSKLSFEQLAYLNPVEFTSTNFILEASLNSGNISDRFTLMPVNGSFKVVKKFDGKKSSVLANIEQGQHATYEFILKNENQTKAISVDVLLLADKVHQKSKRFQDSIRIKIVKQSNNYELIIKDGH